jgi:transcriptional regulator with XRE-family HTH domain
MESTSSHIALAAYIKAKGLTQRNFAASAGIREDQLSRYIRGHVTPERGVRLYLALFTEGAVPADGWAKQAEA